MVARRKDGVRRVLPLVNLGKYFFLFTLTAGLFWSCSSFTKFETSSPFRKQPITIDGSAEDWQGDLYVVENERFLLGFLNDQENLYMCLYTEDSFTRGEILLEGLTVWFDPQAKEDRAFGIRYPLGNALKTRPYSYSQGGGEESGADNVVSQALSNFEIVTFGTENTREKGQSQEMVQRVSVDQAKGIEMKLNPSSGHLVYELRIPLVKSDQNPIAVGVQPGKPIGIGFETGRLPAAKTPRKSTPREFPGGGTGETSGGGRMGGYGGGGGMFEGIKIWAIVHLSSGAMPQKPESVVLSKF